MKTTRQTPANYRYATRGADGKAEVIECTDCRNWIHRGSAGVIQHSSRCDHKADRTSFGPEGIVTARAASPFSLVETDEPAARAATDAEIRRDAKRGEASRHSEETIRDAVDRGVISESDAMNRDF